MIGPRLLIVGEQFVHVLMDAGFDFRAQQTQQESEAGMQADLVSGELEASFNAVAAELEDVLTPARVEPEFAAQIACQTVRVLARFSLGKAMFAPDLDDAHSRVACLNIGCFGGTRSDFIAKDGGITGAFARGCYCGAPVAQRSARSLRLCAAGVFQTVAEVASICVFCGSSRGVRSSYQDAARQVGVAVARRGWTLIYGGGHVGLMGILADAALGAGGKVVGVIPQMLLDREVGHAGLTELCVVPTMAERKRLMGERSDAFLTLPGGIGTLDELSEAWTWTQLGLQRKPSGLLNVDGYFDSLIEFLDRAVAEEFLATAHRQLLLEDTDAERLLDRLIEHAPSPQ